MEEIKKNDESLEENILPEDFEIVLEDEDDTENSEELDGTEPEGVTDPDEGTDPADAGAPEGKPPEKAPREVPISALQKEREKARELKARNAELERVITRLMNDSGAATPAELEERMDNLTLQRYVDQQGMDENTARLFMEQQKKLKAYEQEKGNASLEKELTELSGNEFYSDIDEVRDEVLEYAKKKGLTVKEAYNALFGESRAMALKNETAATLADKAKQGKRIAALSSSGSVPTEGKKSVKLTREEASYADAAGMSYADYVKFRKK